MAIRRCSALDKRYIFEYDVGQWTFGTIQVLKDRDTGHMKTCKIVKKSMLKSTLNVLPRLKALQELQHPHICSITDVIEDANSFFVITDFWQGGDVQDWMERLDEGNWLQEQTCAAYIRQAILALTHSHAAQVYHRDLRPSNLLLTSKLPDAQVKVADFGLAAVLDPDNSIIQANATSYTCPEVLKSAEPLKNGSTDMWSIGAIAHALLTGQAPSEGGAQPQPSSTWSLSRRTRSVEEDAWADRSESSRDFARRCLRATGPERPTAPVAEGPDAAQRRQLPGRQRRGEGPQA